MKQRKQAKPSAPTEDRARTARKGRVVGGQTRSAPGLLGEARRSKILEWMQEEGTARVRSLAEAFDVSEVTIRQDLERLEAEGHVVREHGGAFLKSVTKQVQAMALHHMIHMDAKRRIGAVAAAMVSDGETIILDSGSTCTEVASNLVGREGLTIVTNALNIALFLGALPTFDVHMPGGHFKAPTLSLSGDRGAAYFEGLFAQKLFLATAAVSLEAGLTFPSLSDLAIKRAMTGAASEVILVADSSKIGKRSFTSLGGVEVVHTLVTDSGITDESRAGFESAGVRVILA